MTELSEMVDQLKQYEKLGTPEEIDNAFDAAQKKLKEYQRIGNPESIQLALNGATSCINRLKETLISIMKQDRASSNIEFSLDEIEMQTQLKGDSVLVKKCLYGLTGEMKEEIP